jgi:hypothetical protein
VSRIYHPKRQPLRWSTACDWLAAIALGLIVGALAGAGF